MQKIWNWTRENAGTIAAVGTILIAFIALVQFTVLNPIHQRFDAQDKRLDDIRAEMNQRFDAQDKYINQRFDDQGESINQRFDAVDQRFDDQGKSINQRFDDQGESINQRFDAVDQRLEGLENEVSGLRRLSDRVSRNEGQIDAIRRQLQTADAPPD